MFQFMQWCAWVCQVMEELCTINIQVLLSQMSPPWPLYHSLIIYISIYLIQIVGDLEDHLLSNHEESQHTNWSHIETPILPHLHQVDCIHCRETELQSICDDPSRQCIQYTVSNHNYVVSTPEDWRNWSWMLGSSVMRTLCDQQSETHLTYLIMVL